LRFALFATNVLLVAAIATGLAASSPASAASVDESLKVTSDLTAQVYSGPTSRDIVLPNGVVPTRLQGRLESSGPTLEPATIGVANRVAVTDALAPAAIDVPLSVEDVEDSAVRIWLVAGLDDQGQCEDWERSVTLSDIVITYTDSNPSRSVAEYLTGTPETVTVVVAANVDASTQQAALNAATVMARLFPASTTVEISNDQPPPSDSGRVLTLRATAGPTQLNLTPSGLTLTGDSMDFDKAVQVLGSSYRDLLSTPNASQVTAEQQVGRGEVLTFDALGANVVSLTALGTAQRSLTVAQSSFARPSQSYTVELFGEITAVAGGTGRVNLLWDGQLLQSLPMTEETEFAATLVIDSALMRREGSLTMELQYLPASGTCTVGQLPARLDIDGQRSAIAALPGGITTGFEMFPQVFEDTIMVAFGQQADAAASLSQAAALLVALQRMSTSPLLVELMDWPAFVAAETPGIATGLTADEAGQINTPLLLAPFRTVDVGQKTFSANVSGSFAALQAFRDGGRPVLALGGVGDQARVAEQEIIDAMTASSVGFAEFSGDVAAAQPGQEPFDFTVDVLASQPEQVDSRGLLNLWWLWIVLAGLVVAAVVGYLNRRRS
jgi:hypothetical protein